MSEDIQKTLAAMLERIETLEAKTKKIEKDTMDYIDAHLEEHLLLTRMVYPAYFKTHPEAMDSIQHIHEIFHKKTGGPDDKKE